MQKHVNFIPALIVIGAMLVGVFVVALYMWPKDSDFAISMPFVHRVKTNTNATANTNSTSNTNAAADPTAGWKSYTSTKNQYSFRYPTTWVFDNLSQETGDDPHLRNIAGESREVPGQVVVEIQATHIRPAGKSMRTIAEESMNPDGMAPSGTLTDVTLGTIKALKVQHSGGDGPDGPGYFIPKTDTSYFYVLVYGNSDLVTVEKILSTITNTDPTVGLKTYTNTENGFSLKFPTSWVRRSEMDGSPIPIVDDNNQFETFSEAGVNPTHSINISVGDRTTGKIVHQNTIEYWRLQKNIAKKQSISINGIQFTKFLLAGDTQEYYLLEHGSKFYELTQWGGVDATTSAIISSFTLLNPSETLTKIEGSIPFTSVKNIRSVFGIKSDVWSSAVVSIMGNQALVGGWQGKLFLYNGAIATDYSEKLKPSNPILDQKNVIVRGIGNNGSYWLVSTALSGISDRLLKFDGKTWTELTESFHAATPDIGLGGAQAIVWNGKYWLIGDNTGRLVKFDGKNFTDLTDRILIKGAHEIVNDIAWNGKYFLISVGSNTSTIFKYEGSNITALTGFAADNTIQQIGWNGTYWLLGALEPPYIIKYDGKTITPLHPQGSEDVLDIAWVKPYWIVTNDLFDGNQLDSTLFTGLSQYVSISVGSHFGLIVDNRGDVIRFDF